MKRIEGSHDCEGPLFVAIIFCDLLQEEVFTVLDVNTTIRPIGGYRPRPGLGHQPL